VLFRSGTGIGLHLARLLVELHHGVIYAENRNDTQGSRFTVRLPMGNTHIAAGELENPKTGADGSLYPVKPNIAGNFDEDIADANKMGKARTKYKILIVEDEDEIRSFIKGELSPEYKIWEARNGKEALDIVFKDKPDLVISDIMMPDMDGILLSNKIKQNINVNDIPIILLTAKVKDEDRLEGLSTGADAYITKPFSTEVLKHTISNLITNRERLRSRYTGGKAANDMIQKIELKSSDEILIERIMKVINEELSNPELDVEMLASKVGMSRVHLYRKLKELTNQSVRDFIKGNRLKQAASLLSSKKLSISEVAYVTGFSNLSHFSNSFKEFYGVSPSEYQNQNQTAK
jgi:YesN/AraC family two-component response regulator